VKAGKEKMADRKTSSLGVFFRQLRKLRKMTLQQLADCANVGKSSIQRWESGQSMPRENELRRVLCALSASEAEQYRALSLIEAPWAYRALQCISEDSRVGLDNPVITMPPAGCLLTAMRKRNGLNGHQSARLLGVHPSTLLRWERNETAVPAERMDDIAKLYRLNPQERAALEHREAFAVSALPQTVDGWLAVIASYYAAKNQGEEIPGDLLFLLAEAHLQPFVSRTAVSRYALAHAYYAHGDYLYIQGRYNEAAEYASKASLLFGEIRSTSSRIDAEVLLIHSLFPGERPRAPKAAIDQLNALLQVAPTAIIKGGLLGDMTHFARIAGQADRALQFQRQATATLAAHTDDQDGRDRLLVLSNGCAKVLIGTRRAVEAETYLPDLTDQRPYIQFPNKLIWISWFIETKQAGAAESYLSELIPRLVATNQGRYLRQAQALALRL
jgi:transcriptional regulator with XRE-family HTH domain